MSQAKYVTLQVWAERTFGEKRPFHHLRALMDQGRIQPAPFLAGGKYQVDRDAIFQEVGPTIPPPPNRHPSAEKPTRLYRHFNAAGELLYVGISLNPFARLNGHAHMSHWSDDIVRIEIERHPSRDAAEAAERAAIAAEKPRHNFRHAEGRK